MVCVKNVNKTDVGVFQKQPREKRSQFVFSELNWVKQTDRVMTHQSFLSEKQLYF